MPIRHECGWELPRETTLGVCPRCGKSIGSGYEKISEMTGRNHGEKPETDVIDTKGVAEYVQKISESSSDVIDKGDDES